MNNISTKIRDLILSTWNKESFIILLEQKEEHGKVNWQTVIEDTLIPKFEGWRSLSSSDIESIISHIDSIWKISDYIYRRDYLYFLDHIVKEEDFNK